MLYICSLPNRGVPGKAKELFTDDPALIEQFAKAEDRPGRGVYTCINPLKPGSQRRCLETVAELRFIYFDLDLQNIDLSREEVIRKLQQLPFKFTFGRDSGSGNLHIGIEVKDPPLPGTSEYDQGVTLWKRLIDKFAADPMPSHPAALIRRVGTHNTKDSNSGLCCELWNGGPPQDLSEIQALDELLIQPLLPRKPKPISNAASHDQPDSNGLEKRRFDQEERQAELHYPGNIHLYERDCTASLIATGVDLDDAVNTALEDVRAYIDTHPPARPWNWDRERRRIVRMSYSWVNKHPEFAPTLPAEIGIEYSRILHAKGDPWLCWDRERKGWWVKSKTPVAAEDMARARATTGWRYYDTATPEPMKWSIKGILIEQGLTILSGQWGTYKTTVALSLALSVMTGLPFAGRYRVKKPGGIIYFAAEGAGGIDYRLKALAQEIGTSERLPFAYRPDCPPLKEFKSAAIVNTYIDEAVAELKRTHGVGAGYVMFDTWAKTSGAEKKGEDDDSAVTAAVIRTLDAVGAHIQCGILAIDHMGKDVERGTRGSSGKEAIDGLLATLGERSISSPLTQTRLVVRKVKDGPAGFEVPFTPRKIETGVDEDGDSITAILLDWGTPQDCAPKPSRKSKSAVDLLLASLDAVIADEGVPFERKGGPVQAAPTERVREKFYADFRAKDAATPEQAEAARKRAFNRAVTTGPVGYRTVNGVEWLWRVSGK